MKWLVAASCLLTACGDDDSGSAGDASNQASCAALGGAHFCDTFDEPGHDTAPFGFSMFDGAAMTTLDGDGLALVMPPSSVTPRAATS